MSPEIIGSSQKKLLLRFLEQKKIPQAVIFSGGSIEIMEETALWFLEKLNCPPGDFQCQKLFENKSHPDILIVRPESERFPRQITIEQVRDIQQFLSFKPYNALFKGVVIENAESLNVFSQNALLKTLEEPSSSSVLILLAKNHYLLLETVRSRCYLIRFPFDYKSFSGSEIAFSSFLEKKTDRERFIWYKDVLGENFSLEDVDYFLKKLQNYLRRTLLVQIEKGKTELNSLNKTEQLVYWLKRIEYFLSLIYLGISLNPKTLVENFILADNDENLTPHP